LFTIQTACLLAESIGVEMIFFGLQLFFYKFILSKTGIDAQRDQMIKQKSRSFVRIFGVKYRTIWYHS